MAKAKSTKKKGMTEAQDMMMDRRMGMPENGRADRAMDRKMGVGPAKGKAKSRGRK